jgi:hypothetical protein
MKTVDIQNLVIQALIDPTISEDISIQVHPN